MEYTILQALIVLKQVVHARILVEAAPSNNILRSQTTLGSRGRMLMLFADATQCIYHRIGTRTTEVS